MHFLGGLLVGLSSLWLLFFSGYIRKPRPPHSPYLIAGLFGLCVGLLWEAFEITIGVPRETRYLLDTATDLFLDILGALFGALYSTLFEFPKVLPPNTIHSTESPSSVH